MDISQGTFSVVPLNFPGSNKNFKISYTEKNLEGLHFNIHGKNFEAVADVTNLYIIMKMDKLS